MANTPNYAFSLTQRALAPLRGPAKLPKPANMNGAPVVSDEVLVDTLRHFGEHGLGAAAEAIYKAKDAHACGDQIEAQRWLEICRALDRRMASRFEDDLTIA
ncbi:hypothetical protein ACRAQ6_09980 [Erythrobacter sp. HA6-11]